ncbi:MAG: TnsA endonuclease N-terminal domain-containing protein [Acidobacteria bacterium]|nr:TnsA endonuclease N-terminal domain-containing protein [Acidobacteriota bacterium]MCI0718879.1 TnsA endonuclease N-terminal domain-containing protein [Acidobacteriota bacterium]
MLNKDVLLAWCRDLNLSEQAQLAIHQIRSTDPARRVRGGRGNVSGRYPSRKMEATIQFESHRVELAGIYEMERDPDVLEYYDQPPPIKLDYQSDKGRRLVVLHTPDFFVIRKNRAGWEEWKTEEDLSRLNQRNHHRYSLEGDQCWRCPPGDAYARDLGFYYRVRSSREIQWVFQRNIQFLEDYFRSDPGTVSPMARERVLGYVSAVAGLSLQALLHAAREFLSPDDIYLLIASDVLYVDLYAAPLVEPGKVFVFPTADSALVSARIVKANQRLHPHSGQGTRLCVGSTVTWDSKVWKVINAGDTMVSLLGDEQLFTELPVPAFEALVKEGRISGLVTRAEDAFNPKIVEKLSQASEEDLRLANYRFTVVSSHLSGESDASDAQASGRTLRRWISEYRAAQAQYGSGYLGLLPRMHQRGNRLEKLTARTRFIMKEFIDKDYETLKQKSKYASWIALKHACDKEDILAPSYTTFRLAVSRQAGFNQTFKRQGRRAAYRQEPFYVELDLKTPRHGDRPFEIGHIDHTEMDVEVICSHTGRVLGRPWMTILTDAFCRRVLAVYITFDPPSYRSCMMVLRECVRRHGRLPQIVVVDGGREFESTYFETLLARYECTKKTRPPAKARFGSVCERLFGTTNSRFIHNLKGNTQITRNVRQVTKSVNPKKHTVWTLGSLYRRLCEFAYEVYDTIDHPTLGQSPGQAFASGVARTGLRPSRLIPYDDEFLMLTLPTTPKGTAKVVPGQGVKINYLFYWCDAFRDPSIERTQVKIRYDPYDAGTAYAFVRKQWVRCHSEYFATFHKHSEREILIATKELLKTRKEHRQSFSVTAKKLAAFFESVEAEERLLTQRLHDTSQREIMHTLREESNQSSVPPRPRCDVKEPFQDITDPLSHQTLPGNPVEIYDQF